MLTVQPRIMSCCHKLCTHAICIIKQLPEFQPVVALHARIWRATAGVFINEIIDDLAELGLQIESVKWNLQPICDSAGVFRVTSRAASLLVVGPGIENWQPE